jgi:hypothetical protein
MSLVDTLLTPFRPRRQRRSARTRVEANSSSAIRQRRNVLNSALNEDLHRVQTIQNEIDITQSTLRQAMGALTRQYPVSVEAGELSRHYINTYRSRIEVLQHNSRVIYERIRQTQVQITQIDMAYSTFAPSNEPRLAPPPSVALTEDQLLQFARLSNTPDEVQAAATELTIEALVEKDEPVKKKRGRPRRVDVAEAVVEHTEQKAQTVKERMDGQKVNIDELEKSVAEANKRLITLRKSRESLEEKYNGLTQKKRSELVAEYRRVITQLKMTPVVDDFRVDQDKRIIVRTKPLAVKKARWRKERVAGVYEMRIDFSKKTFQDGIQLLNITQRYEKSHDSPTISETKPCWGNIFGDIEVDFNTQDLRELVLDLVDYITSPYDGDGYLSDDKDYNDERDQGGWDQFFKKAQPQPENYSFEKYDQDNEAKKRDIVRDISDSETSQATVRSGYEAAGLTVGSSAVWNEGLQAYAVSSNTTARSVTQNPQEVYEMELAQCLVELGFTDRGARYFASLINPEQREAASAEMEITSLDLRKRGDEIQLFVMRSPRPHTVVAVEDPAALVVDTRRIDRYFANTPDIRPETLRELDNSGVRSYRVDSSRFRSFRDTASHTGGADRYDAGAVRNDPVRSSYEPVVPDQQLTAIEHQARALGQVQQLQQNMQNALVGNEAGPLQGFASQAGQGAGESQPPMTLRNIQDMMRRTGNW